MTIWVLMNVTLPGSRWFSEESPRHSDKAWKQDNVKVLKHSIFKLEKIAMIILLLLAIITIITMITMITMTHIITSLPTPHVGSSRWWGPSRLGCIVPRWGVSSSSSSSAMTIMMIMMIIVVIPFLRLLIIAIMIEALLMDVLKTVISLWWKCYLFICWLFIC